jgi:MFS family permease
MERRKLSYHFIVLMGMVSLFGDVTYEGGRSITGAFLAVLGAGAGIVGFVVGLGEFLGYAFRLASGYFVDRTKAYWPLTFAGYALIFAIPLMAFAGNWQIAAVLVILERLGKAVRTPARDTILSHAAKQVGRGWGFGLHEFFDQIGAVAGPLIFTAVFLNRGSYGTGFKILFIPTAITIGLLFVAQRKVPHPEKLETPHLAPGKKQEAGFGALYWIYLAFTFFSVGGVVHFSLISFHLKVAKIAPDVEIPIFYVVAMALDGIMALVVGKIYDRVGLHMLLIAPFLSLPIPFLAFSDSFWLVGAGAGLWGLVLGVHETIMRAAIGDLSRPERRGTAYGIFNAVYGLAVFAGSALMGLLYEVSFSRVFAFSVLMEAFSIGFFLWFHRYFRKMVQT